MDPISAKELLKLLETVLDAAKKAENDDTAERVSSPLPFSAFKYTLFSSSKLQFSSFLYSFLELQDRAVDGLNALAKAIVTTGTLGETQAGKKVRVLTKHSDEKIASGASKVVSCWKDLVRKETGSAPSGSQATASGGAPLSRATSTAAPTSTTAAAPPKADDSAALPTPQTQPSEAITQTIPSQTTETTAAETLDPSEIPTTGDTVRDKVRTNLVTALHRAISEGADLSDAPSGSKAAIDIGVSIELALYAGHNGVSAGYKAKFRQLHFNLKDDKNPDLRRRVLEGIIAPDVLISLTPEELASDAKREENDRIREKKLFDAAPSSVKLATTDQFQCGKCKKRQTTYYQMQTRSADEPMTTFVRCVNCGNAWKFC
jgi:transcription elongation factor S-II